MPRFHFPPQCRVGIPLQNQVSRTFCSVRFFCRGGERFSFAVRWRWGCLRDGEGALRPSIYTSSAILDLRPYHFSLPYRINSNIFAYSLVPIATLFLGPRIKSIIQYLRLRMIFHANLPGGPPLPRGPNRPCNTVTSDIRSRMLLVRSTLLP